MGPLWPCFADPSRVADWVRSCQTYEAPLPRLLRSSHPTQGGFSCEVGCEAHGGYALCANATLQLLGEPLQGDAKASLVVRGPLILLWADAGSGGCACGKAPVRCAVVSTAAPTSSWTAATRTGRSVPGRPALVSYCQAASLAMIPDMAMALDWEALHTFILSACQSDFGGLCDKPGKCGDERSR